MRSVLSIFILFFGITLYSQNIGLGNKGTTRALVIGISEYQDDRITNLQYAHKDAIAFSDYLKSEQGYNLPQDQVVLLINEEATHAQFWSQLEWLLEETQEGDQVIIYFSGHGDVEVVTRRQRGFLLCWDTPPQSYVSGAMHIYNFEDVIETLELTNKASVVVITDACRSGKLAGSAINGAKITNANLAERISNEIKILSCQPDEFSHEGEQWGGGRGAFSYHLIRGLYGLADENEDQLVSLKEIERYLEDHVTPELAPIKQNPFVVGGKQQILGKVNPDFLNKLKQETDLNIPTLTEIDSKGIEDLILETLSKEVQDKYAEYKKAIKQKYFFEWSQVDKAGLKRCADDIYRELSENDEISKLHSHLKRNYAAALQDDAQQFYNSKMKGDLESVGTSNLLDDEVKLISFANQLERAAELIGRHHYIYKNLKAKQAYFKAEAAWLKITFQKDEVKAREILSHLFESVQWEPNIAQTQSFIGFVYASNLNEPDSAVIFAERATALSPSWVLPYASLADVFIGQNKVDLASDLIERAWMIDSTSVIVLNAKAKIKAKLKKHGEAEELYLKAIEVDPTWSVPYKNLAYMSLSGGKFKKAESNALKALELDQNQITAMRVLGWTYIYTKRRKKAEGVFLDALERDDKNLFFVDLDLSMYYSLENKLDKCFTHLEALLSKGYKDYDNLHSDGDLGNAWAQKERWKNLMDKYFPDN